MAGASPCLSRMPHRRPSSNASYCTFEYLLVKGVGARPVYEGSWVQKMNEEGYSVCGLDQQGAGRSGGLRSFCSSFDEYVDNSLMVAKQCTERGLPGFDRALPKFIIGASAVGIHTRSLLQCLL